jgi:hypothetical protein
MLMIRVTTACPMYPMCVYAATERVVNTLFMMLGQFHPRS